MQTIPCFGDRFDRAGRMAALVVLMLAASVSARAEESAESDDEAARRATAVALNYCRASFHRIRRQPTRQVLIEERQRILNNVDLNRITDEEVIRLYSSVLSEISQVTIADTDRRVTNRQHSQGMQKQLITNFFVLGTQIATGQVGNAVRSGANSWWDMRNRMHNRDKDVWNVDKKQMTALVSRSSEFLNAFWKLSKRNNIPDEWLVREIDLDRLQTALQERDPDVRYRILSRMERFMQCYPPYWYHLARTQQQMGRFADASGTYQRLASTGGGYFRQDDMLASGMANLALIQEFRRDPNATRTAQAALRNSNQVWEANFLAAWVLARHSEFAKAEDALLCNLDVKLEKQQSSVALASVYYKSHDNAKLTRLLEDREVVAAMPIPGLLLCAGALGTEAMPASARQTLVASVQGFAQQQYGRSNLTLVAGPTWKLANARIQLQQGQQSLRQPQMVRNQNRTEVRLASAALRPTSHEPLILTVDYPNTPTIRVQLDPVQVAAAAPQQLRRSYRFPMQRPPAQAAGLPAARYQMSAVEIGRQRLSLRTRQTADLEAEIFN